jgi:hypothetical protein
MFTKNRRGEVNKKLYFDLSSTGDVRYLYEGKEIEEIAEKVIKRDNKEPPSYLDILFGM